MFFSQLIKSSLNISLKALLCKVIVFLDYLFTFYNVFFLLELWFLICSFVCVFCFVTFNFIQCYFYKFLKQNIAKSPLDLWTKNCFVKVLILRPLLVTWQFKFLKNLKQYISKSFINLKKIKNTYVDLISIYKPIFSFLLNLKYFSRCLKITKNNLSFLLYLSHISKNI